MEAALNAGDGVQISQVNISRTKCSSVNMKLISAVSLILVCVEVVSQKMLKYRIILYFSVKRKEFLSTKVDQQHQLLQFQHHQLEQLHPEEETLLLQILNILEVQ